MQNKVLLFIVQALKWFFSIISFILVIQAAENESWLSGLLFLLNGLLLFPLLKPRLQKLSPVLGRTSIQFLLFFIIFVVSGFNMKWSTEKSLPENQNIAVVEKETTNANIATLEKEFNKAIKASNLKTAAEYMKRLRKFELGKKKLSKYENQLATLKDKEKQKTLNEKYKAEVSAFKAALGKERFKEAKDIINDIKDDDPDFKQLVSLEEKLIKALSKKQSKDIRRVYALLKKYEFEAAEELISTLEDSEIDQKVLDKFEKEKLKRIDEKKLKDTLKVMSSEYEKKNYREVYSLSEDMLELFPKHKKVNWYHRNSKKEENNLVMAQQKDIEAWGGGIMIIGLIFAYLNLPGKKDGRTKSGYKSGEEGDMAGFMAALAFAAAALGIGFFISFIYGKLFLL